MKPPAARDLLAGIDHIAWPALWAHRAQEDSPRDARDVPRHLRTLARLRGGNRVRHEALFQLECTLEHQGSLSDATDVAIPFLYTLLRQRPGRVWQRRALLELLALFAVPQPGNLFPDVVDPTRDYAAFDPRCFHACADPAIALRSFSAVEAGLDAVLPLVRDASARVGCEVIGLISQFQRRSDVTLPVLRALPADADPALLACALIADAMLAGDERRVEMIAQLGSASPRVQLGAACALAIATPDDLPAAALAILCRAIPDAPVPFAFGGGGFPAVALACIARLPPRHDDAVIGALIAQLVADPARPDVLWLLLARAFPGETRARTRASVGLAPPAPALTDRQRRTLVAIRDHVDLSEHGSADALSVTGIEDLIPYLNIDTVREL
jgi:hypothetical protein